jgi:hypothetical protein
VLWRASGPPNWGEDSNSKIEGPQLSEFQVLGASGYTRPCLVALDMILSGPLEPQRATVISNTDEEHLFVLWDCWNWPFEGIIIPTGFKSGYSGEGARGFSLALCMLYEHNIPIDRLTVTQSNFERIDEGYFPRRWQEQVSRAALACAMPVPEWVFENHWELTKAHRLWRVQLWRNTVLEWTYSADIVDDFSWIVGDKLHQACSIVKRNARSEECQQSGLVLRDAWIEFSQAVRAKVRRVPTKAGRNDVKAVIEALNLNESLARRAKKAFDYTNVLQHDRGASREKARACFDAAVDEMAGIVKAKFPGQVDPNRDGLIRGN